MAGNIDTRTEIIPANGVVKLANANFLFVITTTGAVAITLQRQGIHKGAAQENYSGVAAGLQVARTQPWDFANVTGTPGVTLTFMYGNTSVREDVTLFNQQIAVISGVTATAIQPASTVADTPFITTTAGQHTLVPQNLLRRRVTITNYPTSPNTVDIRKTGGTNSIFMLQPGTFAEFDGTYGLDYLSGAGGETLLIFEET